MSFLKVVACDYVFQKALRVLESNGWNKQTQLEHFSAWTVIFPAQTPFQYCTSDHPKFQFRDFFTNFAVKFHKLNYVFLQYRTAARTIWNYKTEFSKAGFQVESVQTIICIINKNRLFAFQTSGN